MRLPIDPGDRKILIVAGLLLALTTVAAVLLSRGLGTPPLGYASSYSAASDGAKGAYLLLGELGYRVERWVEPPENLPSDPQNTVLILADPIYPASAYDEWRIQKFVSDGGQVLATGVMGAWLLPGSDLESPAKRRYGAQRFRAQLPGPISDRAPDIELEAAASRWGQKQPQHVGYYADAEGAVVVAYHLGKGQVVWWAASTPLTNYGMIQAFNLMLLMNSLGRSGRTRVLWDEYFHGQRMGFASYLQRTPVPWALLQCLLLGAVAVITYSRRSGPVRALAVSGARLSPLEFVETLGDLYQRKRAAPAALEIAYQRFRFLLLRRLGLPSGAKVREIELAARQRLAASPDFLTLVERCDREVKTASGTGGLRPPGFAGSIVQSELSEDEALDLICRLREQAVRWRWAGKSRGT